MLFPATKPSTGRSTGNWGAFASSAWAASAEAGVFTIVGGGAAASAIGDGAVGADVVASGSETSGGSAVGSPMVDLSTATAGLLATAGTVEITRVAIVTDKRRAEARENKRVDMTPLKENGYGAALAPPESLRPAAGSSCRLVGLLVSVEADLMLRTLRLLLTPQAMSGASLTARFLPGRGDETGQSPTPIGSIRVELKRSRGGIDDNRAVRPKGVFRPVTVRSRRVSRTIP